MPKLSLVPFLSFLPTSTVYSRLCFAGLLHPAADHGVHHVSDQFLTFAGQETAQGGSSPLAAAFAISLARRPPLTADADWSFPKEPVEGCESSPSEPKSLRPKTMLPLPWHRSRSRRTDSSIAFPGCPKAARQSIHVGESKP